MTKPVEGAKSEGVGGFFKGIGKGAVGLVAKPVSGVVDFVSKTAEGVESNVTGIQQCKQNSKRAREPRPFYRDLQVIKDYDEVHALVYNIVRG